MQSSIRMSALAAPNGLDTAGTYMPQNAWSALKLDTPEGVIPMVAAESVAVTEFALLWMIALAVYVVAETSEVVFRLIRTHTGRLIRLVVAVPVISVKKGFPACHVTR